MGFTFKARKGSSSLSETPFYTGQIQNNRIMTKKETYAHLVEAVGGKKADHSAAWKGLAMAICENAAKGNSGRVDGLGIFRNTCKGAFESSKGPWTKGKNTIQIACLELNEFKNALKGVTPTNNTQGDRPVIKSVLNTTLDEYDVVRINDTMSMGGSNLAPDTEKTDEYIGLFKDDILVRKATITKSELNTVEFKFTGEALAEGQYKVAIYTRCGDSGEGVSVKSASRVITVRAAA